METAGEALQQSHWQPDAPGMRAGEGGVARWPRGCPVRVRGRRWHVQEDRAFSDCHLLVLAGAGRRDRGRRAALLCPFDRPQRLEPSGRLRHVTWQQWLRAFRLLAAGATPCGRLRTASTARIDLHPYQIEPSLAFLGGMARRLLLADEVGLGKTIQAGLIVSEIHARQPGARTLILTPAGLRDQWACELRDRFAIEAAVVDAMMLRRTLAEIAAGTNPWAIWPVIVVSFDFVKRPDVVRALEDFTWDALVVDEAHQCAVAPERSAAVRLLASRSRHVLLLTATPHAGDDEAFERLCNLGRIDGADSIVMFRRSRSDAGVERTRRVRLLRVRCSDDERRMHRLLDRYTNAVWTSAHATADARLAMIVLRKRALSSAVALAQSLERRMDALFDVPSPASQMALPFPGGADRDEESPEDDEALACLGAPGLEGHRERAWLNRVLAAAHDAATRESKLHRLARLLVSVRQPAIIFTEYRDTARWLASALQMRGRVALLHGGLSRAERQDAEHRFRTGQAEWLVATDAAGQGLNLHHRCRLVVNLELPWNPMRLEQRIGRIDRLGQARRPHAIHLVARDTAEEQIVRRLVVRQQRARRRVGEVSDAIGATREEDVVAAVMACHRFEEVPGRGDGVGDQADRRSGGLPRALSEDRPCAEHRSPGAKGPPFDRAQGRQPGAESTFRTIDLRALAVEEVARLSSARRLRNGGSAGRTRNAGTARGAAVPRRNSLMTVTADRTRAEAGAAARDRSEAEAQGGCIVAMPGDRARRSDLRRGVVCIFLVRAIDTGEDVADESLVSLHLSVPTSLTVTTAALAHLGDAEALRERALAVALPHVEAAARWYRCVTAAALECERAIGAAEARPAPLQPGMFDRRAQVEAERRAAGRAARDLQHGERLAALTARISGPLSWRAELVLALIVP